MIEARVFYVGRGNAVVLCLGEANSGKYGIIDCYEGDDGSNPLMTFLSGAQVESIEFVVVTHPHRDHFCGIRSLFRDYGDKIKRFYDCGVDPRAVMAALYNSADASEYRTQKDLEVLSKFCLGRRHRDIVSSITSPGIVLYEDVERGVLIDSVAPIGYMYKRAEEALARYFRRCKRELQKAREAGTAFVLPPPRGVLDLNHLSSAIRVKQGQNVLLLGGDVLRDNWKALLRHTRLPANVILLSHHGSQTGFPADAWGDSFGVPRATALISGEGFHQPSQSVLSQLVAGQNPVVATGSLMPLSGSSALREYVAAFHHKAPKLERARQDIILRFVNGTVRVGTERRLPVV